MADDRTRFKEQGSRAFRRGITECPFQPQSGSSLQRTYWWEGWLEERIREKFCEVFRRNGLAPYPPSDEEMQEWNKRRVGK